MMLIDLADACRRSGLEVVEVAGWRTRGNGQMLSVSSIIGHHTATAASAKGDYPSLNVVRDGTSALRGTLAQVGLGRSGKVYVIAAGLCWHAGVTFHSWQSNPHAIGIEAEHPGKGGWPTVQYDAYVRLCRALADHYDVPYDRVLGHKEIAKPLGRKIDPNFDMEAFRAALQEDQMNPSQEAKLDLAIAKVDAGRDEAQQIRLEQKIQSDRSAARDELLLETIEAIADAKGGIDTAAVVAAVREAFDRLDAKFDGQIELTLTAKEA